VDNELNALYEAQTVVNKELCEFRPVVQTTYLHMHQVDAISGSKWDSLVASNPKECITDTTHQFVAKTSLLAKKWQDKVDNLQEVRKRSLKLVLDMGPSFEEEKLEIAKAKSESNS
jgi:hypothetical protein